MDEGWRIAADEKGRRAQTTNILIWENGINCPLGRYPQVRTVPWWRPATKLSCNVYTIYEMPPSLNCSAYESIAGYMKEGNASDSAEAGPSRPSYNPRRSWSAGEVETTIPVSFGDANGKVRHVVSISFLIDINSMLAESFCPRFPLNITFTFPISCLAFSHSAT